jgi:hypothetical protein
LSARYGLRWSALQHHRSSPVRGCGSIIPRNASREIFPLAIHSLAVMLTSRLAKPGG